MWLGVERAVSLAFMTSILRFLGTCLCGGSGDDDPAGRGLRYDPALMLIDDADKPGEMVLRAEAARLDAERTGEPMKHPMDGR